MIGVPKPDAAAWRDERDHEGILYFGLAVAIAVLLPIIAIVASVAASLFVASVTVRVAASLNRLLRIPPAVGISVVAAVTGAVMVYAVRTAQAQHAFMGPILAITKHH